MLPRVLIILVLAAPLGCAARYASNTDGTFVSDEKIVRIEEAKTGADWIRLMLGPPDEIREDVAGKVWIYNYHETHIAHGASDDQQWFNRITFVSINPDGSVGRVWAQQAESKGWSTRFE